MLPGTDSSGRRPWFEKGTRCVWGVLGRFLGKLGGQQTEEDLSKEFCLFVWFLRGQGAFDQRDGRRTESGEASFVPALACPSGRLAPNLPSFRALDQRLPTTGRDKTSSRLDQNDEMKSGLPQVPSSLANLGKPAKTSSTCTIQCVAPQMAPSVASASGPGS